MKENLRTKEPILYVVIPCYNEEDVLPITSTFFIDELEQLILLNKISNHSKILFVDDGSTDATWKVIEDLSKKSEKFVGIW